MQFEQFDPAKYALLGSGLWGDVLDLDDGTVLKVARESCAGIGSGIEKIQQEFAVLTHISRHKTDQVLSVPQALGWGRIPVDTLAVRRGFSIWLHTSKVAGVPKTVPEISKLGTSALEYVGVSIGEALAHLHQMLGHASLQLSLRPISFMEIRSAAAGDAFALESINRLEAIIEKVPQSEVEVPIHGDFNISNILFANQQISGVVDFAETCRSFREKDISDIINELPMLEDPLVRAYKAASGVSINSENIQLGLAMNALCSMLIGRRMGDMSAAHADCARLKENLAALSP